MSESPCVANKRLVAFSAAVKLGLVHVLPHGTAKLLDKARVADHRVLVVTPSVSVRKNNLALGVSGADPVVKLATKHLGGLVLGCVFETKRAVVVLDKPRVIDDLAVFALWEEGRVGTNLLPAHVRCVVHNHLAVAKRVGAVGRARGLLHAKRLVQLAAASTARHNVNRRLGFQVALIRLVLVGRPVALVVVLMAVDKEVDALVEKQLLEAIRAVDPRALTLLLGFLVAVAIAAAVHAAVTVDEDPWHVVAVGVGLFEVGLKPFKLLADHVSSEHVCLDLSADADVVDEAGVPRKVHVVWSDAVDAGDGARVGRHVAVALHKLGNGGVAVLVVANAHHVREVG
eukprot:m.486119 g.486119  ORF g.486119 m.486119 type:complete len:343 (-) comp24185_c0_seq1:792-1820(-)